MPNFRADLVAADGRPLTAELVRNLCGDVTRLANFLAHQPLRLASDHDPNEETFWELFHGQLLDGTHTRQRRRFEAWNIYQLDDGGRSAEPILSVKFDELQGRLYVTRSILMHAHETYDAGDRIVLTREVRKWQRELVGSIALAELATAGELRDELACQLFLAVVGTSRLPLTSVETPLPAFSLGWLGYCYRPAAGDSGPATTPAQWRARSANELLSESERVKDLELLLRATPVKDLVAIAAERPDTNLLRRLRAVFNAVTLSPYTNFAAKAFAFLRQLEAKGAIAVADRIDTLCHLVRQLGRHLAAYDLVTFHNRGANYPDALLLADLLAELLPLAEERPELFAGADRDARLRCRAIRHGILLRMQYAGHPVPDAPTSGGENRRVLPAPFLRVPNEQIESPATRRRRLFDDELSGDNDLIRACLCDLDQPEELLELGTALFLDRPLGFAKAPGEPDQTWLASHVLVSRAIAEERLQVLARRPEWLPDDQAIDRWQDQLRNVAIDGLPLRHAGPPPRPGVSLHDALRVADDFVFLRTTRRALDDFWQQYELQGVAAHVADVIPPATEWRLLVPGTDDQLPTLCLYDQRLRLRLELAADLSKGYLTRGGCEFPAAGLRVLRAWRPSENGVIEQVELCREAIVLPIR